MKALRIGAVLLLLVAAAAIERWAETGDPSWPAIVGFAGIAGIVFGATAERHRR